MPIPITNSKERRKLHTPCGQNCAFCSMYKDEVCSGCPNSQFSKKTYKELLESK